MVFETLKVAQEGGVLFADIAASPMNLLGPALVRDLVSLVQQVEADRAVKVCVFKSADPDYFIPHVDVTKIKEYRAEAVKLVGEASIGLLFRHLSASRIVSIAQIEGRVRAAGSEFVRRATCGLPRGRRRPSVSRSLRLAWSPAAAASSI
jgi:enoyl-CoA hydratase/carnithine racemase